MSGSGKAPGGTVSVMPVAALIWPPVVATNCVTWPGTGVGVVVGEGVGAAVPQANPGAPVAVGVVVGVAASWPTR